MQLDKKSRLDEKLKALFKSCDLKPQNTSPINSLQQIKIPGGQNIVMYSRVPDTEAGPVINLVPKGSRKIRDFAVQELGQQGKNDGIVELVVVIHVLCPDRQCRHHKTT